jgi:serine/threonine-protein kinase
MSLRVVPPRYEQRNDAPARDPDWNVLFAAAGLDGSKWKMVDAQFVPPVYADTRGAWEGVFPERPDTPVHLEAAAHRGRLVSFNTVVGEWPPAPTAEAGPFRYAPLIAVVSAIVVPDVMMARRNLRMGRGDRRGATKLVLITMGCYTIYWILATHHVSSLWEIYLILILMGWNLILGALVWVLYLSLEPAVRRQWPEILVSSTRLLAKEWRDPRVGRDVLAGCGLGGMLLIGDAMRPGDFNLIAMIRSLEGAMTVGYFICSLLTTIALGAVLSLAGLSALSLLRALVRSDKAAMVIGIASSLF